MPYIFLKSIIESAITNYLCPQCQSKTNEQSIAISAISSHGIDLTIHCPACGTHAQMSAEINTMASQLLSNENGRKFLEEFVKNGGVIDATVLNKQDPNYKGIRAEDIEKVDADIKNARTIEDLMGE